MDWMKVLQVAANYLFTFLAGWGSGVLAGLDERECIAFGFVTLGANVLGLHQEKPRLAVGK